jgi:endonuclease-3 related protein
LPKVIPVRSFFETLLASWGEQNWWPADSPFEVIVGAILTQNTAWTNVEMALANLREVRMLTIDAIRRTSVEELEQLVRPAGFYRQKAARLKTFIAWLDEMYEGSLDNMFRQPTALLRAQLLEIKGIGPETADSILLYAGQHEIFVVDAYTRRIFERHDLIKPEVGYEEIRELVETALQSPGTANREPALPSPTVESGPGPAEEVLIPVRHSPTVMSRAARSRLAQTYNEFHALLVQVAKHYCQSRVARCEQCPLRGFLERPVRLDLPRSGRA